jgi:hypothetical protein
MNMENEFTILFFLIEKGLPAPFFTPLASGLSLNTPH